MMSSFCMPCMAFVQTDVHGLLQSGEATCKLAQELVELSDATQEKDRSLMGFAETERDTCRGLDTSRVNVLKPDIFLKLMDLVDDSRMMETIQTVKAMKENTEQCLDKSVELSKSIQTSIDCLPSDVQEAEEKLDRDISHDEEEEEQDMIDLEQEIADLKDCTEGIRSMNIFNAAQKGTRGFVGLAKECQFLDEMFDRIKELSQKVAEIAQSFMVESCCAQIVAGVSSLKDLKRCLRLSTIITKFADASKRLVEAILEMIEAIKEAFSKFIPQFEAAKKIKNSPVVKFGSSMVSKFTK